MPQTYKGAQIPIFGETADAVVLAQDLIDAIRAPGQSEKTADYVFTDADANDGTIVKANKATAIEFEIPPQVTEPFIANTILRWVNVGVGDLTIAPGAAVTFIGETLVFATGTGGMAIRNDENEWVIVPFAIGGDVPAAVISSGGTVTTYSAGGIDYQVNDLTASGNLVVDEAGVADVVLIGAGGGGGSTQSNGTDGWNTKSGGGGGGEVVVLTNLWLPAGSHACVIGAGGAGAPVDTSALSVAGGATRLGNIAQAIGGGCGGSYVAKTVQGANTGGAGGHDFGGNVGGTVGTSITGVGYVGGAYAATAGGGGGGAGGNGSNATSANGGAGGPGVSNSIRTGSAETWCGGGGGGGSTAGGAGGSGGGAAGATTGAPNAGTANTGGGGGGHYRTNTGAAGANGGSGRLFVRTVVGGGTTASSGIVMSGGTESTYTGNGTNGVLGQDYKVHSILTTTAVTVTTFPADAECDIVVVAGGGGGGTWSGTYYGGGGGGGGVLALSGVRLPVGSLTCTIGAGGAKGVDGTRPAGNSGSPSSIGGLFIAPGGGFGGAYQGYIMAAGDGGSGGGVAAGAYYAGLNGKAISGSPLGYDGGTNAGGFTTASAGGGGAGAVGGNAASTVGGNGGAGKQTYITGTSAYLGGGGGGGGSVTNGTGGTGGGANGGNNNGTANTGGGGGGGLTTNCGNGGSGAIYIRYKV